MTTHTSPPDAGTPRGAPLRLPADTPTPLWAAFVFTFLNSVGGMTVTSSGLFFLTKQGYHFSDTMNALLGVLLGVMYIVGAIFASRFPALLRALFPGLSQRGVLGVFMGILALLCAVPMLAQRLDTDKANPNAWPIWTIVLLYTPVTGMLWPIVESYISGGRSATNLRRTIGTWNIVWSSSGIFASFLVAPLVYKHATLVLVCVGFGHLIAGGLLAWFSPQPAAHAEGSHEPHPPVYAKLLVTFRLLLPMSYVVCSSLGPFLPRAAKDLGVAEGSQALIAIAWLLPRVCGFIVMQRWQGWHGRWFVPIVGGAVLVGGFSVAISATKLPPSLGLGALITGLAFFGVGMSIIYSGAIYYAMEVGQADVDAGGTHEALIGVGYMAGPAFGLFAWLAVNQGMLPARVQDDVVLFAVLAVALATGGAVLWRIMSQPKTKQESRGTPDSFGK